MTTGVKNYLVDYDPGRKKEERPHMQFAINTPNFGQYGDARVLAELAHEAEEAGSS